MYYEYEHSLPQPSSWNKYPTQEEPSRKYKFTSLEVSMSPNKQVYNRQTYSLLDWLGDLGGLYDALILIASLIVAPISAFNL